MPPRDCPDCKTPLEYIGKQPFPAYYPRDPVALQPDYVAHAWVCPACGLLRFYAFESTDPLPASS